MSYLLYNCVFLLPAIGMVSGFSAALIGGIFSVILLLNLFLYHKGKLPFKSLCNLGNNKLQIILCLWLIASCLWSSNSVFSLKKAIFISCFILVIALIIDNIESIKTQLHSNYANYIKRLRKSLIYGLIVACSIFYIEKYTQGNIANITSLIFSKQPRQFFLYSLDRGCAILSVTTWVVICSLLRDRLYSLAVILYSIVLGVLLLSDSTSSLLAYLIASFVLLASYIGGNLFYNIYRKLFIVCIIALPISLYFLPVADLVDNELANIPLSAKHRLFIWQFVIEKIRYSPWIGYGVGASKIISQSPNDAILYHGTALELFPLHPHNSILQLYLELGIIGIIIVGYIIYQYLQKICNNFTSGSDKHKDRYFIISVYVSFTNYLIISMISYSVWQSWWVFFAGFTVLIINLLR